MKSVTTNLSAGLLLAALAMAATSQATAQEYTFTTLAGPDESPGAIDGTANAARFGGGFYIGPCGPCGAAVDSVGNVYVADSYNQTIRKVTPGGVVTTLAGLAGSYGGADGTGSGARFNYPSGVAVDSAGNVYVADTYNNTIRRGFPALLIASSGPAFAFTGGQFGFTLNGLRGQKVVVEASTDLTNWRPIWTNTLTFPAPLNFTDPESSAYSIRFYRARTP